MKGVLVLIESKNPSVFDPRYNVIDFTVKPRIGEPFLFTSKKYGFCNTSDVKSVAIDSENGDLLIQTRNSLYKLEII